MLDPALVLVLDLALALVLDPVLALFREKYYYLVQCRSPREMEDDNPVLMVVHFK